MKKKIKAVLRANYETLRQYRDGELSYGRMANILAEKIEEELERKEEKEEQANRCQTCNGAGYHDFFTNEFGDLVYNVCYQCEGTGKVKK